MIGITVKVDAIKKALDRYLFDIKAASGDAMTVALDTAEKFARFKVQAQTTRRTGALEDGIASVKLSPFIGKLFSLAKHSRIVEDGSRPHGIKAVNARFLRFEMNGAIIYARRVHHPGTHPRPFMAPAAIVGRTILQRELQARVNQAAKAFAA